MMGCIEMHVLRVLIDHKVWICQCDVRSLLPCVVLIINFLTRYFSVLSFTVDLMCSYFLSSSIRLMYAFYIIQAHITHTHTHISLCVNICRNPLGICRHVGEELPPFDLDCLYIAVCIIVEESLSCSDTTSNCFENSQNVSPWNEQILLFTTGLRLY